MSDPYAAQKKTKTETQRKILDSLRDEPATFTDLRKRAGVSATILAKHLKELQYRAMVVQRVEKGNVLYERTDKARKSEEAARSVIQIGLQNLKSLPQDKESLSLLSSILALAKDKPEYFDVIIDWLAQLAVLVIGAGKVTWLQGHEGRRAFQDAINAREWKPPNDIKSPADMRNALASLQEVIRDVLATEAKGVTK